LKTLAAPTFHVPSPRQELRNEEALPAIFRWKLIDMHSKLARFRVFDSRRKLLLHSPYVVNIAAGKQKTDAEH
jgi:hypothetical protein